MLMSILKTILVAAFLTVPVSFSRADEGDGIVEAGVKYIKGSFVPLREFRSFADANGQVRDWIMGLSGTCN